LIWENSTCTAVACRIIGTRLKKSYVEELFLLGLLHDLGKLVLMRQIPKEYTQVVQKTKNGENYYNIEQKEFGFSHPLIGALVAKKWNFSPDTCQVILHHHDDIPSKIENELQEKTCLITMSNLIAHALGVGHEEGYPDTTPDLIKVASLFEISEADIEQIKGQSKEMFDNIGGAFM
jgi:HD-like signal output (HDOD) protein